MGYGDEYDSSEEQEPECSADSARAYGKVWRRGRVLKGGRELLRRSGTLPTLPRAASACPQSDRARLVDMWIESALLVSRDVRLDKRHFDRTTRQNLKKMRPASAQVVRGKRGWGWGLQP